MMSHFSGLQRAKDTKERRTKEVEKKIVGSVVIGMYHSAESKYVS